MTQSNNSKPKPLVVANNAVTLESLVAPLTRFVRKRCLGVYYKTKERFGGSHKRDIIVYRVDDARSSLEEAKEQFQTALEAFSELTGFEGGALEQRYHQLKAEYDHSQSRASAVQDRIHAIEEVAEALFDEWREELEQYNNRSLRSSSRQQLKTTEQHYKRLLRVMRRAEAKISPVLSAFHDQVLFLKHNLNAQAIASLHNELASVSMNVASLIRAMETSINEANAFVSMLSLQNQRALPPSVH